MYTRMQAYMCIGYNYCICTSQTDNIGYNYYYTCPLMHAMTYFVHVVCSPEVAVFHHHLWNSAHIKIIIFLQLKDYTCTTYPGHCLCCMDLTMQGRNLDLHNYRFSKNSTCEIRPETGVWYNRNCHAQRSICITEVE